MSINWGMICDGGVFESLVHSLLFAKDTGTILFGRPGKDSAQDAISADGSTVYQSKFRQDADMAHAIAIAQKELGYIGRYRDPTHQNFKHWKDATRWILVGNFRINPNDHARWLKEVVPKYAAIGLAAEYWTRDDLDRMLETHPEIRHVFFEGENRVLVGLSETYLLLSSEFAATGGLDTKFINRPTAMDSVSEFVKGEKRILPIYGPNGVGKTRLLYECMSACADEGWRVLWGLTNSMAKSSKWFQLLNGSQKTLVVLDNPTDSNLVQAVIEQLSTTERKFWKVLIACQSQNSESVRRLSDSVLTAPAVKLDALSESESKELIASWSDNTPNPAWVHSIFQLTGGIPGWINLVGKLFKEGKLEALPQNASQITRRYIQNGLDTLPVDLRDQALNLLHWLALWDTLTLDAGFAERPEFVFLEAKGVPSANARRIIEALASVGIINRWGVEKRVCGIQQRLIKVELLADWLLDDSGGKNKSSLDGKHLTELLIEGQIPNIETILRSLAILSRSRLDESESMIFMKSIFEELTQQAVVGDSRTQQGIVDLVVQGGPADPEASLDVLSAIRRNPKEPLTVETVFGPYTYDRESIIQRLPWTLFQIAEHVSTSTVAHRFLVELFELSKDPLTDDDTIGGKRPKDLIHRLLCDSRISHLFTKPACELASGWINANEKWPFVSWLIQGLSCPIRETVDWIATGTVSFRRHAVIPGGCEWEALSRLRDDIYRMLGHCNDRDLRCMIWQTLSTIHHEMNRALIQVKVSGESLDGYQRILDNDLVTTYQALANPPIPLSIEEGTIARSVWEWYLKYGESVVRKDLASKCEAAYRTLSRWRIQEFFAFSDQDSLHSITQYVAGKLCHASEPTIVEQFFQEAQSYLSAARSGKSDGADQWRLSDLADACITFFNPIAAEPTPLTQFVVGKLREMPDVSPLASEFCIKICKRYIGRIKTLPEVSLVNSIVQLAECSSEPDKFLTSLYVDPHPQVMGALTEAELHLLLEREEKIDSRTLAEIMAGFSSVNSQRTREVVEKRLAQLDNTTPEPSQTVGAFICSLTYSWSRHGFTDSATLDWIFDQVIRRGLDSKIIESHELERLRDKCGFRLTIQVFADFIQSRLYFDTSGPPYHDFQIIPFDFRADAWCDFDAKCPVARKGFDKLCSMVFSGGFIATSLVPSYLAQLDPTGTEVSKFIEERLRFEGTEFSTLRHLAYLVAAFKAGSNAWRATAIKICEHCGSLSRVERERLYRWITNSDAAAYWSEIGKAPSRFYEERDYWKTVLSSEPIDSALRSYFEWAYRNSEATLQREIERAEEELNERT